MKEADHLGKGHHQEIDLLLGAALVKGMTKRTQDRTKDREVHQQKGSKDA